ncbi:hypothetical protein PR202_gb26238 [Eleusine coracana subsp. coracana]|uniref:Peptidase A1 domain-containing protein n=1 Tax=Eleusine coracana subsp. coracana TaxID=191504 RepID=A0AAV5FRN6_ELECO|nr:hypothetical protein PR202_gb26238 [Eleusine coracana subsp. coracana]
MEVLLLFVALLLVAASSVDGSAGFSVELIHRDSALSPLHDPALAPHARMLAAARRSLRSDNNSGVVSEIVSRSFEYLMSVNIGTPPTRMLAIADTGSDLIWVTCRNDTAAGAGVEDDDDDGSSSSRTVFDQSRSSTYAVVGSRHSHPLLMDHSENLSNRDHTIDIPRNDVTSPSTSHQDNGNLDESHNSRIPSNEAPPGSAGTAVSNSGNVSDGRRDQGHRQQNPLNSVLWISIDLLVNVSLIIAAVSVLSVSRNEHPHAPLFEWLLAYTIGCIATLHIYIGAISIAIAITRNMNQVRIHLKEA